MTQFQSDLVKIILDKGLLTLILVGFSFYLNRLIEKFRARNNYEQKISEHRIDAYKEILFSIHEYDTAIYNCLQAFKEIENKTMKGADVELKTYEPQVMGIVTKYDDMKSALQRNSLFLSGNVINGLNKFIEHRSELKRAITSGNPSEFRNMIKAMEDTTRDEGVLEIQATMLKEIFNFKT